MDNYIQVCTVYTDAVVQIYSVENEMHQRHPVQAWQFETYGHALQFAQDFEQRQREQQRIKK